MKEVELNTSQDMLDYILKINGFNSTPYFEDSLVKIGYGHKVPKTWLIKNKTVNIVALTSLVVIFVWLSPLLYNPYYFLIIPFFHSLQYFLFSGAYTKNKIIKDTDIDVLENTEENILTLITCVENEPNYRRCVQAEEKDLNYNY